jgi:hypothetical protein
MPSYTRPEQVAQYIVDTLNANKIALGIAKAVFGEANLIIDYPAALVVPDPLIRTLHATGTWRNEFHIAVFVYHAKLTVDRETRTKEDLQLVTAIVNLLHNPTHRTLNGNIDEMGFFDSEAPGFINRPGIEYVIGSRLTWTGAARQPFPSS